MEIHKIKPIHGWREFFGEVGIIVLGVCIALLAEQAVERAHWRHEVEAGEEALAEDFAHIVWYAREREWLTFCAGKNLDALGSVINEAALTNRLPPTGISGQQTIRFWSVPSWESLVATGVTSHFPHEKLMIYTRIVNQARFLDSLNQADGI